MIGAARFPNGFERRAATVELRVAGRKLVGLAAPFNSPAQIGGFTERLAPGAFAASLASGADVRCLVDHDDDRLLGRTRSGTLRLVETRAGLEFELDIPDTQLGRDTLVMAERGDLSGCSFGFTVPQGGDHWPTRDQRELRCVNLAEISVLNRPPAYAATAVAARALGRAEANARIRRLFLETL